MGTIHAVTARESGKSCMRNPDHNNKPLADLDCGPLSFWFLNHWLEEDELVRQIGELKKKGFAGFFMHPRGGLNIPYGSGQWYQWIELCVKEARRQGMEAWLYDEDPYPSGAAGGRVIFE